VKKNCLVCNKKKLFALKHFHNMVSSDIKKVNFKSKFYICSNCLIVQKDINKTFIKNINLIYKNYEGFNKFKDIDQKKISNGIANNRCQIIYERLIKKIIKNKNIVLDYGSSNGAMIEPLLSDKKNILIEACDIKNNLSSKITKNKKFKKFNFSKNFLSSQNKLIKKYDLITLIHVFEHLLDPLNDLKKLSKKLNKNGKIFIQIPNFYQNPYDLIVYDHTAHYTRESILNIANLAGMNVDKIYTNIIDCEFSIILSNKNFNNKKSKYLNNNNSFKLIISNYDKSLSWLNNQIKKLTFIKSFNILGSSIAATWIHSYFISKKINFYEEDINKKNKIHLNKKIKILKMNRTKKLSLFLPFAPIKLLKILKRFKKNVNIIKLCPELKI